MSECQCGMKMYWNWDTTLPYIFFSWWKATNPAAMLMSCTSTLILSFLYEGAVQGRAHFDSILSDQCHKQ